MRVQQLVVVVLVLFVLHLYFWSTSMTILNHIGIAVQQLPELTKLFSILSLNVDHVENVPDQGVMTHFIPLPQAKTALELLEVSSETSPVAQFLKKRGPGIHHLSFEVKKGELDPICKRLLEAGFRLIYDRPREGAQGMRINFLHPSTSGGILIELMELD